MLRAVIIYNIPQAIGVCATVAGEEYLVVGRRKAASCQAAHKCGGWLNAVIEDAAAARAAGWRGSRGEDAVRQVIRAVRG